MINEREISVINHFSKNEDDEIYNLYFQDKLKRSQEDIKNGRVITLEQLDAERKSLYESYTIQ